MDQHRLLELAGVELLTEALDASQEFCIASVARADIAEMVNGAIDHHRLVVAKFEDTDPRLTPKFCNAFAQHMRDWHEGFQESYMMGADVSEQVEDFISEIGQSVLRAVPQKKATKRPSADKK